MILNSDQIKEIIPHRYPMLLVDTIEMMDETTIMGRKCISSNEWYFTGHFPEKQVMPGVLIVESLAQTGAVLLLSKPENKGKIAYFAGINKFRFKKQVIPGDVLDLIIELKTIKGSIGIAKAQAMVADQIVAFGEIMFGVAI